ncbi:hypothetical protein P4E94_18575 [Pontiellaceae bacterium B12219]|nr:hypothetical protein [Pontiellaceae bacterium B12219]
MKKHLIVSMTTVLLLFCVTTTAAPLTPSLAVSRLNQSQPIIDESSFTALGIADDGHNIGGPSCIRVPDWVPMADRADPAARYYLYFSNHSGKYIRMAWAADIEGPWSLFNCGTANDARVAGRGVLDLGPSDEIEFTSADGIRVSGHIASPDVVVDHTNQQFMRSKTEHHGFTRG